MLPVVLLCFSAGLKPEFHQVTSNSESGFDPSTGSWVFVDKTCAYSRSAIAVPWQSLALGLGASGRVNVKDDNLVLGR